MQSRSPPHIQMRSTYDVQLPTGLLGAEMQVAVGARSELRIISIPVGRFYGGEKVRVVYDWETGFVKVSRLSV